MKKHCVGCNILTKREINLFDKQIEKKCLVSLCKKCQELTPLQQRRERMRKTREARWKDHKKKVKSPSIRDQVRERDGNLCIRCKISNDEHLIKYNRQLSVHRKVPGRFGGKYELDNCITLCCSCHSIVEADIYNPPKEGLDPLLHGTFRLTRK